MFVIVIKHHFSPHVIMRSFVCVFVCINVFVCVNMNMKSVITEGKVRPGPGDDDLYVCMCVGG